jgi:hypothetical protein
MDSWIRQLQRSRRANRDLYDGARTWRACRRIEQGLDALEEAARFDMESGDNAALFLRHVEDRIAAFKEAHPSSRYTWDPALVEAGRRIAAGRRARVFEP